jgi:hypothetical protein
VSSSPVIDLHLRHRHFSCLGCDPGSVVYTIFERWQVLNMVYKLILSFGDVHVS